jgi:succinate dehydrogenase/fumarate reductase flavoprotein subunit
MAEGHMCGRICMNRGVVWGNTPPENFWNLMPGNAISCIPSDQICSKIYANNTCIWNKRTEKTNKRFKKILTIIYHYFLEGDSNDRRPRVWPIYHAWMGGVWGNTPPENFWNLKHGNAISCILSIQFALKFTLTMLVNCNWNKRKKKRTKNKR